MLKLYNKLVRISPSSPPPPGRIVLADDSDDASESMAVLLEWQGYVVATARDGQEAVVLARSLNPQIILLDLAMPGMDGFQAAHLLRSDPRFKTVYMAAITGHNDQVTNRRVAESGFDAHFPKPVNLDDLFSALRQALLVQPS